MPSLRGEAIADNAARLAKKGIVDQERFLSWPAVWNGGRGTGLSRMPAGWEQPLRAISPFPETWPEISRAMEKTRKNSHHPVAQPV